MPECQLIVHNSVGLFERFDPIIQRRPQAVNVLYGCSKKVWNEARRYLIHSNFPIQLCLWNRGCQKNYCPFLRKMVKIETEATTLLMIRIRCGLFITATNLIPFLRHIRSSYIFFFNQNFNNVAKVVNSVLGLLWPILNIHMYHIEYPLSLSLTELGELLPKIPRGISANNGNNGLNEVENIRHPNSQVSASRFRVYIFRPRNEIHFTISAT